MRFKIKLNKKQELLPKTNNQTYFATINTNRVLIN